MRQIGTIETESQARIFRSYLLTLGMHADVEQTRDKKWAVWVHEETRLDEGRNELQQFLADPKNERYQSAAATGEKIEKQEERENKKFAERQVDMRTHWHMSQMVGGPLTLILIMISVAVYIFQQFPGPNELMRYWLSIAALETDGRYMQWNRGFHDVFRGQVWRVITPIFLHFSILHILFNMMWLKLLGGAVEGVEGTLKLALHAVVYAIAGNVLQYYLTGYPTFGGMSGVNYGLFAYVWLVGKYHHEPRYHIDSMTVGLMMVWFFAGLFNIIPNIANGAHAGGLVMGALWATVKLRRIPFTAVRF